jgi:hypothetical protein
VVPNHRGRDFRLFAFFYALEFLAATVGMFLVNGGCIVIIGLGLIAAGIGLLAIGGLAGGFGIILLLVALGVIYFGVMMLKEWH